MGEEAKVVFDADANAVYFTLRDVKATNTIISDAIALVNTDDDGNIVSIEVFFADERVTGALRKAVGAR